MVAQNNTKWDKCTYLFIHLFLLVFLKWVKKKTSHQCWIFFFLPNFIVFHEYWINVQKNNNKNKTKPCTQIFVTITSRSKMYRFYDILRTELSSITSIVGWKTCFQGSGRKKKKITVTGVKMYCMYSIRRKLFGSH